MWRVGVVVRRYINILIIIINFPYSTCIRSFFGSSILTSLFIFKCFFGLYIYISAVLLTSEYKKKSDAAVPNKNVPWREKDHLEELAEHEILMI